MITKVLDAKFIYECDLRKFFDRVKLSSIQYDLGRYGVPEKIIRYLDAVNKCTPKLPSILRIDESKVIDKKNALNALQGKELLRADSSLVQAFKDRTPKMLRDFPAIYADDEAMPDFLAIQEEADKLSKSELKSLNSDLDIYMPKYGLKTIRKFLKGNYEVDPSKPEDTDMILQLLSRCRKIDKFLSDSYDYEPPSMGDLWSGVVQGFSTSPFLAILILKGFLTQGAPKVKSVSYADDPIFYSDEDFEIKGVPLRGIEINESKSG